MKTFNKKGDKGKTSLLFGKRVDKDDPRCEAYGTIDEANSILGVAKNLSKNNLVKKTINKIQEELFTVGAELATPRGFEDRLKKRVDEEMVRGLEEIIEEIEEKIEMPKSFTIPGGSLSSSFIDLARSTIRRAERRIVSLHKHGEVENPAILSYINRLGDLLYSLARYEERG